MSKDIKHIINGNDINALISYVKLLFEKNGDTSKILGPLGEKFVMENDARYKDQILNNLNNLNNLNDINRNVHRQTKYDNVSEIENIEPSIFQDTKNSKLQQFNKKYFANEISEKEYNLSDMSACIYLTSLIFLFIYIVSRCKKCKRV